MFEHTTGSPSSETPFGNRQVQKLAFGGGLGGASLPYPYTLLNNQPHVILHSRASADRLSLLDYPDEVLPAMCYLRSEIFTWVACSDSLAWLPAVFEVRILHGCLQ